MDLVYIICYFATLTVVAYGSPTIEEEIVAAAGNRIILRTKIASSWVEGPNVRGTSEILRSCIITLIACIYTAIHLNIPPAGEGRWHLVYHKSKWVAMALFAPEVVLYTACRQLVEARMLVEKLNELRSAKSISRAKTKNVPEEPAKDLELGEVCTTQRFFGAIANVHRTRQWIYILRNSPWSRAFS